MADELDTLVLKVRTDTAALAHDAAEMKALFTRSAEGIADALTDTLSKLITQGKLGLEDWKRLLREILTEIAKIGTEMVFGAPGNSSGGSDWGSVLAQAATLLSTSGRATGGPVSQGRAYMVGERGPEIFVPERAGRIETLNGSAASRPVNITIHVAAPDSASPQLMQRSANQVARAVRRAVAEV